MSELIAGRYELVKQLGRGAMGVVFLANDRRLSRQVAVKVLTSAGELEEEIRRLFEQEARRAAALSHPHIITVHDAGEDESCPYIVMELLEGHDLRDLLQSKNPPPLTQLFEWYAQVCDGLAYAHRQGVVHRDLKPGNIRITLDGQAKIVDFGIARVTSGKEGQHRTGAGVVVGTAEYMSPEGILGKQVDHRADIFSMGVILYELITHHRPFEAPSVGEVMSRIVKDQPNLSLDPLPRMPDCVHEALTNALAKAPEQRYQSVGPLAHQVRLALGELLNRRDEIEHSFRAALSAGELTRAEELLGRLVSHPETRPADLVQLQEDLDRARSRLERAADPTDLPFGARLQGIGEGSSGSAPKPARVSMAASLGRRTVWAAAAAGAVGLALVAVWWLGRRVQGPEAESSFPSIAVLPFVDLSPTKDQGYFSDGLSEELLNTLAKNPKLRVAARTSSFQFKGKTGNIESIGKRLKVATVLEGSVRKSGNQVRIAAQLVSVADGYQLWSATYDRTLDNIFAVQDDIASSVAEALKVRLLGRSQPSDRSSSRSGEAYNGYLQGKYFFERRSKESMERAVRYFEQSLQLDPGYAPAWAALAQARAGQADLGHVPADQGYREARQAAERALALDHGLAEAHAAMGWIKRSYDWDWSEADASFQRALKLKPGGASIVWRAAVLAATLGRFEEAVDLDRRSVQLDPLSVPAYSNLGLHAYRAGRLAEAEAAFKKALELNPEIPGPHSFLGRVYLAQSKPAAALAEMEREPRPIWRRQGLALAYQALGRRSEADAALAELIEKDRHSFAFQIAEVYAYRGEQDKTFEWLERAYVQRDVGLAEMKGDPLLLSLKGDPRFAALLKKMRLPP